MCHLVFFGLQVTHIVVHFDSRDGLALGRGSRNRDQQAVLSTAVFSQPRHYILALERWSLFFVSLILYLIFCHKLAAYPGCALPSPQDSWDWLQHPRNTQCRVSCDNNKEGCIDYTFCQVNIRICQLTNEQTPWWTLPRSHTATSFLPRLWWQAHCSYHSLKIEACFQK